jgi:hypothetical protein
MPSPRQLLYATPDKIILTATGISKEDCDGR